MLTMYSKDVCGQCKQAEVLFKLKGVSYEKKLLNVDFSIEQIKEKAPNEKSFPIIFDGDKLVGSLAELKLYLNPLK